MRRTTKEIEVPLVPRQSPCSEESPFDELADIAYVVPVEEDGWVFYTIHDEDGLPLAVAPSRALAFAAIRQHGMHPVDAH